jgi:hypothetical protein
MMIVFLLLLRLLLFKLFQFDLLSGVAQRFVKDIKPRHSTNYTRDESWHQSRSIHQTRTEERKTTQL